MKKNLDDCHLSSHEWTAVLLVLLFFLFLIFINLYNQQKEETSHFNHSNTVSIHIEGAVECPGKYECHSGITLKQALNKAKVLSDANLKKLKLKSRIYKDTSIIIEKEPKIKVGIKLDSNEINFIELLEGDTLKNLFYILKIDLSHYKRSYGKINRKLKDGEIIELIPKTAKN